jgi:hypothetical protein
MLFIMSNLLIASSPSDNFELLIKTGQQIAKAFDYKIITTTYNDVKFSLKNKYDQKTENLKIIGSEANFTTTLYNLLNNTEYDFSIILIPPHAVDFKKKSHVAKLFSVLKQLKTPYLIIPDNPYPNWKPHHIFSPVCTREGEKEASAWVAFWTRINNSKLTLLLPEFRNQLKQKKLWMLQIFMARLLKKSGIPYDTRKTGCKQSETIKAALEIVRERKDSLLILPASRYFSPEYYFTGIPEFRILKNRGNTPVLFVNPRHDLYVPCG